MIKQKENFLKKIKEKTGKVRMSRLHASAKKSQMKLVYN